MRAFFKDKDPNAIIAAIRVVIQGRRLGELTRLSLQGDRILASISKMGTSTLTFAITPRDNGTEVTLTEEKLALAHRPLRREVHDKFVRIVEQAGGELLDRR